MAYKTLFTAASQADQLPLLMSAAALLCTAFDAHLDVLALGVDRTQIGYSYVGTGALMIQASLEQAENDARQIEAATKTALQAESDTLRYGLEAAVAQIGGLTDIIASRARFADLVVLPRPYGDGRLNEAEAMVEAALFEGRSPVLVLPDKGLTVCPPRHIVVAWNQSAEAMAAVRHALPLLKQAEQVDITVIDPPGHGPERSDPGGMICQMLVRHGVKAEITVLARTLPRVSDVLARHITDRNADMLVMGAYGHSRFREAILGGATRHMLEEAKVPFLMAH
jgi:nucleotide-binding universal stress UspA family protein